MSAVVDTITGKSARKATQKAGEAVDVYRDLDTPRIKDMRIKLDELVSQGTITPQQAETALVDASAYDNISTDPRLKDAQLGALSELESIVESDGLNARSTARLNEIQGDENALEKGSRESILQNRHERGIGGGGDELAATLIAQQGSAGRRSDQNMDIAALAEQQALEAIMAQGNMGSTMRGQDFQEQEAIANAQDTIAKFNASNTNDMNRFNTGVVNDAQYANLAEKQRIADSNVNTGNIQEQHNKGLFQQDYTNKLNKAGGEAGALGAQSNVYQQNAANNAAFTGGIIEAGAKAAKPTPK